MTTKKTIIVSGIISLVVALVVGLGFAAHKSPAPVSTVGGTIDGGTYSAPQNFTQGVSLGGTEIKFTKAGIIPAQQNHATYFNNTGRVVYIDYTEMDVIPTTNNIAYTAYANASSSMRFSAGTTTSNTSATLNTFDYSAPFATLIDNVLVATSTTGVATTSINSDINVGRDQGTVPVLPGQYVYFIFRQDSTGTCNGSTCETATSTNRGFNVHWFMEGHYSP